MKRKLLISLALWLPLACFGQGVVYNKPFSPAEGLLTPVEKEFRHELCLDGYWQVQCIGLPDGWRERQGSAPELPMPDETKWDTTPIKVPSPINVNNWGQGYKVGEGTDRPYVPSSVYFPSYPEHWNHARMAWMRRQFTVPHEWDGQKIIVHFEAVAGDCAVYVNGRECGHHFENHLPFEVDLTDVVKVGETNEIMLGLRHHKLFDKGHDDYPYMGATYPTGSNTDDLIGVWQDVFLEARPAVSIDEVFIQPYVQRGELVIEAMVKNTSQKKVNVGVSADIHEWINDAAEPAEIAWHLSDKVMDVKAEKLKLVPGETAKVVLSRKISEGELKYWAPDTPVLYTAVMKLSSGDVKAERFGWRELSIVGDEFRLNGKKIQCFGDIQHPFSAYVCSRRFAWAWYQMIKDFGGNSVRPHAQPWPRCYYDLADEMGLMVLDETALFGSSIRMNFEDPETWVNCTSQLEQLILRDRNHPSVIGWSAGNETFAIALLNKAPKSVSERWNDELVKIALHARNCDPTRQFVTLDGDRDMDGRLPVWSKHFGHGLHLGDLPEGLDKPLVVGENGATYYGRPDQLTQFVEELPYRDYKGRNEALAIDLYQNVRYMALPLLAYFSPSEVSWFGVEHMNLGYHDFSRLPDWSDGIFPGMEYQEGVPGYQYERIPPYVTTFNPGLDPALPLYKPLAMFRAYKAALAGEEYEIVKHEPVTIRETATERYSSVYVAGKCSPELAAFIGAAGYEISNVLSADDLILIDAANVTEADLAHVSPCVNMKFAVSADGHLSEDFRKWAPYGMSSISYPSTGLESSEFPASFLYFGGEKGDGKFISRAALSGEILKHSDIVLVPSRTDWTLFNDVAEHWKCAQVVLYESLEKPNAAVALTLPGLWISTIDYRNHSESALDLWRALLTSKCGLAPASKITAAKAVSSREFNLLLDGPVD